MRATKTREVILALKKIREEHGYTLQHIQDMVLDNGGNLSLSTVKRVFSDGSEDMSFRYEDSIKPIADVLLKIHEPTKADEPEVEALRQLVQLKNAIIEETQKDLLRAREREAEIRADDQKKIDHLKEQLHFMQEQLVKKDKLLDERRDFIYRKDRIIGILGLLLAVCLVVIIGALIIDRLNPDMGFFWLDRALHAFSDGTISAKITQML